MRSRLRAAVVALVLAVATVIVLGAGVVLNSAGNGCGAGLAAPCQTGGTP